MFIMKLIKMNSIIFKKYMSINIGYRAYFHCLDVI